MTSSERRRRAIGWAVAVAAACGAIGLRADVEPAPAWRLNGEVAAALPLGDRVFIGGPFTQLSTPSSSQDQFYDPATAQPRPQCARSTHPTRPLGGVPDGRGGLLVVVREGDAFADVNGAFTPPSGTTIVRIAENCLWDRGFAAPSIDPAAPGDLNVGVPVPVGGRILAANSVVAPDGFQRAQVAAFDALSGSRVAFQFYQGTAEIGFFGPGPQRAVARVRDTFGFDYRLGAVDPATLELTTSATVLADESLSPRFWMRGTTMFRVRPAPDNRLEAYDLETLAAKSGWTAPVVPALADLEVAAGRVFVTAGTVNGQAVPPPAALVLATGARDASWQPPALTKRVPDPQTPYVPALTHLATDGQRLYFSGDFERVGGADREGVAAIAATSGALDTWDPTPFIVQPLEFTDGGLLMTRPSGTNRVTRRYLAAIDRATGLATAWNPNDTARVLLHTASPVAALATDGAFLYFASATTGEVLRADLATADVDQNWRLVVRRAGQAGSVVAMAVSGGSLYLGGDFDSIAGTSIGATSRRALAAVGLDGVLRTWAPAIDGPPGATLVRALLPLAGTIYVGGDFTTANGQFRLGFAALDGVTGELVQPEMYVLGDTRIHGLATDGDRVYVAGVSFGAPLVGAVQVPGSELVTFGPTGGAAPTSAAVVSGHLYAGLEYDVESGAPTARATTWGQVSADAQGLVHRPAGETLIEYYTAVPGTPPGAPLLTSNVVGNVVTLTWQPDPLGGTPSSYTLFAGSAPGVYDLGGAVLRGTTFTATVPNGTYYAAVVARNRDGLGPLSNEVQVQVGPPPCTVAPTAPGPLTVTTAGFLVSLAWGESPTAAAYILDAGRSPGASDVGSFPLSRATTLQVAAPPGQYFARVRAVSACGVSPHSNEVAIVMDGGTPLPQAPTGLTAIVEGRSVLLTWVPPTAGGTPVAYQLEAGYTPGAANAAVAVTAVPRLAAAGVPPATYYVRVRALNAAGPSPASGEITVVVQ